MTKAGANDGLFYETHERQELIIKLRGILQASSVEITEGRMYGRLTYFAESKPVAFICNKSDRKYIELGFFKAVYLEDPDELFKGKGKEIRRIRVFPAEQIPALRIKRWMKQSIDILKNSGSII